MQVERVNETLYKLTASNPQAQFTVNLAACVGREGILLVDTAWPESAQELNETIRGLGEGAVKLIIITHPHRDHYGGTAIFDKEATLIAHKNAQAELMGRYFALDELPGPKPPIIAIENELALRFNGQDIKIIPMPGHTHSDIVVHFVNSNMVCLGDLIFADSFPGIYAGSGGNAGDYVKRLETLTGLFPADARLITGHGRDYTMDDLKAHYHMAADTVELIQKGIAAGKSVQDMTSQDLLKDWAPKWGHSLVGSADWIGQAYDSLTGQAKKSIAEPLTYTLVESGLQAAIAQYHELKATRADAFTFAENDLNMLGYQLMWRGMLEEAIAIHWLNVQAYPQSANPHDSLGETYLACGDKELARQSYEKALELNPDMPSALEALKTMGAV